jgi:hypothetical protein
MADPAVYINQQYQAPGGGALTVFGEYRSVSGIIGILHNPDGTYSQAVRANLTAGFTYNVPFAVPPASAGPGYFVTVLAVNGLPPNLMVFDNYAGITIN